MTRRLDWEKASRRELVRAARQPKPIKPGRSGTLPATAKQLGYLKGMRVEIPARLTRNQASALIDAKKNPKALKTPSAAEIEAAKTPAGGWTKATLASWGVPWPPPKGWKRGLEGR